MNKKISSQLMKNLVIVILVFIILYQTTLKSEKLENVDKNIYKITDIKAEKIPDNTIIPKYASYAPDKFFDDNSPVNVLENFLSSDETNQIIKSANKRFTRSTVVAEDDINDGRTSSTAHFDRAENELVKKIENKVAEMLKINPNQIEPLQVQRYRKGQQYMPHYDLLDEKNNTTPDREHTVIMYLNDMEINEGGSTFFPIYKIRVFPNKGRAIHFRNIRTNGDKNLDTLHGGDPILGDKPKYILTAWTRNHEY